MMQRSSFGGAFSANFSPLRIRNFRIYLNGQAVSLLTPPAGSTGYPLYVALLPAII